MNVKPPFAGTTLPKQLRNSQQHRCREPGRVTTMERHELLRISRRDLHRFFQNTRTGKSSCACSIGYCREPGSLCVQHWILQRARVTVRVTTMQRTAANCLVSMSRKDLHCFLFVCACVLLLSFLVLFFRMHTQVNSAYDAYAHYLHAVVGKAQKLNISLSQVE